MKSRIRVVESCLLMLVLFVMSAALASATGALVGFNYVAPTMQLTVQSPAGVGSWQVEVDFPSALTVGGATGTGFMVGASQLTSPPRYRWFNLVANGQSYGSLTIPLTVPSGPGDFLVNLTIVNLDDMNGNAIAVDSSMPINVEIRIDPSSISLRLSSSTVGLGGSVRFNGSISPTPQAGTVVMLGYSVDGGSTWIAFLTTVSDGSGSYSATWCPPNPGNYPLRASWNGNANHFGAVSPLVALTVTGSVPASISFQLFSPPSATRRQIAQLGLLVNNPSSATFADTAYIQVAGPNGYVYVDTVQVNVASPKSATYYYDWTVPNVAGAYSVTVWVEPSQSASYRTLSAYATANIQVT